MITKVDGPEIRGEALEDVFEVKFPGADKPIQVTMSEINPNGAMQTDGEMNDRYNMDGMWMRILEAAGGKHAGELLGLDMDTLNFPSEALALKPDVNFGLSLLTGKDSTGYGMNDQVDTNLLDNGIKYASEGTALGTLKALGLLAKMKYQTMFTDRPSEVIEASIEEALNSGNHAVLGGDNHAYTVLDIEKGETAEDTVLVLRNPWGRNHAETQHAHRQYTDGTDDGVLKVPIKDAKKMFSHYFVNRNKPS